MPDRCKLYGSLKDKCIRKKNYLDAINAWNILGRKTMGDYHILYFKTEVLLLADVFEKFVNKCFRYYGLNPCHYFSTPGLSWDAMLKMTEIELELI